jgi:hypothetical protein
MNAFINRQRINCVANRGRGFGMKLALWSILTVVGMITILPAVAQNHPALGKTIDCGAVKAVIATNGDVTVTSPVDGTVKGKLKVVPNAAGFKNVRDLQVVDARGKSAIHFQEEAGRYSLEGDRCRLR